MSTKPKDPTIAASFMRAGDYNAAVFGHVISMPKLNGLRAMWIPGRGFFSRDGLQWAPEVLGHIRPQFAGRLDGELYCHGMSLQQIQSAVAVTRQAPGPDAMRIAFYAFDAPDSNELALGRMASISRDLGPGVITVPWKSVMNRLELDHAYEDYIANGFEGQMIKSIFGSYIPCGPNKSRTMNLQKRKAFVDDEFECVGVEISQEPRMEGLVGKLLFKRQGVTFGVGTGFTKDERAEWAKNPPAGRVATIKYLYISKDGVPNNASFIGWREVL